MTWIRNFEIKKDDKTLGKVICTSKDDNYTEFYGEIIISDLKYIQEIKEKKGLITGFTIPSFTIATKTSTELYEKIDTTLNEILGSGISRNPIS
jgi:hypothetical protein